MTETPVRLRPRLVPTVTPSLADEQDAIALAEVVIIQIKMRTEADKRVNDRAVEALAETTEGEDTNG